MEVERPDAASSRAAEIDAIACGGGVPALAEAHGYVAEDDGQNYHSELAEADAAALHRLLLERVLAKRARDFAAADGVRDRLRDAGVSVDDRSATFRVFRRPPPTGHGYARDDDGSVALSPDDAAQLDALLLERVRAKRSRDFAAADHARDLLRAAGVEVDDRRNTYRVGRPGPPRPRGHGYRRDDDGAVSLTPDDAARLDALLLDRVAAKRERNFDEADRLRAALEAAGVRIDDRDRTYRVLGPAAAPMETTATRRQPVAGWSRGGSAPRAVREVDMADGPPPPLPTPPPPLPPAEPPYARDPSDDSGVTLAAADEALLVARLATRRAARHHRDYSSAQAIRDELDAVASACGCRLVLDDDRRTYRFLRAAEPAAAPAADDAHGFARDDGGEPLPPAAAEAVDALLLARVRAKRSRDFDEADRLRGLLRDEHRVFVDDARRTYAVRPLIERAEPARAPRARPPPAPEGGHGYARDDDGAPLDDAVDELLLARVRAKRSRDFDEADRLRGVLRDEHRVFVDDQRRTYAARPLVDRAAPPPDDDDRARRRSGFARDADDDGPSLARDDEDRVHRKIAARRDAQLLRDFDLADAIRDELRDELRVLLDDRARTFRVVPALRRGDGEPRPAAPRRDDDSGDDARAAKKERKRLKKERKKEKKRLKKERKRSKKSRSRSRSSSSSRSSRSRRSRSRSRFSRSSSSRSPEPRRSSSPRKRSLSDDGSEGRKARRVESD